MRSGTKNRRKIFDKIDLRVRSTARKLFTTGISRRRVRKKKNALALQHRGLKGKSPSPGETTEKKKLEANDPGGLKKTLRTANETRLRPKKSTDHVLRRR